jgi:hypothetical protein
MEGIAVYVIGLWRFREGDVGQKGAGEQWDLKLFRIL